jgi:hypothetical protein
MGINKIKKRAGIESDKKLTIKYAEFEKLISELNKKKIPLEIINSINENIEEINSFSGSNKDLLKILKKKQSKILKLIETRLKLVTKNHYRKIGLAVGISGIGVPFGVSFGISSGNMALMGIGIPIGMAIGIAVGTLKDKKAKENEKQLYIKINH